MAEDKAVWSARTNEDFLYSGEIAISAAIVSCKGRWPWCILGANFMTVYGRATTVNRGSQGAEGDKFLTRTKFNVWKKDAEFKRTFLMNFRDLNGAFHYNFQVGGTWKGRNPFLSALSLFSLSLVVLTILCNVYPSMFIVYMLLHAKYRVLCCFQLVWVLVSLHTAFPSETVTLSNGMMMMTMMSFLASDSSLLPHRIHHKFLKVTRRNLDKIQSFCLFGLCTTMPFHFLSLYPSVCLVSLCS